MTLDKQQLKTTKKDPKCRTEYQRRLARLKKRGLQPWVKSPKEKENR